MALWGAGAAFVGGAPLQVAAGWLTRGTGYGSRPVFPLKDNIPTLRFPAVTVTFIALNVVAYFFWQQGGLVARRARTASTTSATSYDYAVIPYEMTHPGEQVARAGLPAADVADVADAVHRDVHARRAAAPRRQHAVPVDLRQQRRGLDGPAEVRRSSTCSAGWRRPALQVAIDPDSTVPTIGASGAIAGVLGGYLLLFPRARVVTLIFIVFFFTLVELPALVVLGFWFVQQVLFGVLDLERVGRGRRRGVLRAHRRLRVRARWRSSCSPTSASGGGRSSGGAADGAHGHPRCSRSGSSRSSAFLTLYVLFSSGPDVLVVLSLVVLGLFAFGVIGALSTPPRDG